jgi:hypothetical protein
MPLLPPPTPALALAALPSSQPTFVTDYFGVNIPITHPLLTHAAFLSCLVRLEAAGAETLILLDGYGVPIADDLVEQTRPTTMFADWGPGCDSERYEHDRARRR